MFSVDVKPEKGHSFIHLITTGAGERYGTNSNADFYNGGPMTWNFPKAASGAPQSMDLDGGLGQYHNTFMKFAHVYKEHFNSKKGASPMGDVVAECVNPAMHRGELIVKVANDQWHDELEKLANDKSIWFSIGCGVPYDNCSACGNKAPTRKNYCEHMRYNKLGMTKEGHQIFVINDKPHFHDISGVAVPADKIAFGLRKVAAEGDPGFSPHSAEEPHIWLPLSVLHKIGSAIEIERAKVLEKLAVIEKKILAEGMSADEEALADAFNNRDMDEETIKSLQEYPLNDVLGELKKSKVMLPPKAFMRIVLKKPASSIEGIEDMPCAASQIFSDLHNAGDTEVLSDGSYESFDPKHWSGLSENVDKLRDSHSVEEEPVRKRIIKVSISGSGPHHKEARKASPPLSAESRYLAREYAKYQLSFMAGADTDKYAKLLVVHNQKQT
jgi:hypothetical protein